MPAVWPSQVPYRSPVDGRAAGQPYNPPLKSETEGGPPLLRPRPGPRGMELSWRSPRLTVAEYTAFEQFAVRVLRDGTLPFLMPVWKPDGCYVQRLCQIRDGLWSPDFSAYPKVVVSFTLIVWNW
jgi:hypothetical protein